MDSPDCAVELCIHLAPKCIAALALVRGTCWWVRATFTNEHLFLCIAALLHVLCILSCAPGASVILRWVSVTAAPDWRYLSPCLQ